MTIAERIKYRRIQRKMTQQELADALGIDQTQVWRFEAGKSIPYGDVVARMAVAMDTTTDWLLGLSENVKPVHKISDLSEEELELINIVRGKSPDAARKLIEVAKVI